MTASLRTASQICLAFAVGYALIASLMLVAHQRSAQALPESFARAEIAR